MRILIIEDEKNLAEVIAARLRKENFTTDVCYDGDEGLYNAMTGIYDLIIIDVMLPGKNGFEILKAIRNARLAVKVIMLTARSMLEDKLNGLEHGANDYVTKPFHMDELLARINVQLCDPSEYKDSSRLEFGDLQLDTSKSVLRCADTGNDVELVRKELMLMEYFMNNPGQILSKEQIYNKVWGMDNEIESNNLEAYLSFLRKKLRAVGSSVNIKAARGLGYRMEAGSGRHEK